MRLGFYSEVARRDIVRARNLIAEKGYGSSADEIRRFRQELVRLDGSGEFAAVVGLADFYSTSTCRDLLFHVQEQRMTLTGIEAFLKDNGLAFLGFAIDPQVVHAYRLRFPEDRAAMNLAQWQSFENDNPDTFLGMYQFWIQRVVSRLAPHRVVDPPPWQCASPDRRRFVSHLMWLRRRSLDAAPHPLCEMTVTKEEHMNYTERDTFGMYKVYKGATWRRPGPGTDGGRHPDRQRRLQPGG